MRREAAVFVSVLALTALAAHFLPDLLDIPTRQVQETILLGLAPLLLGFLAWTRPPAS